MYRNNGRARGYLLPAQDDRHTDGILRHYLSERYASGQRYLRGILSTGDSYTKRFDYALDCKAKFLDLVEASTDAIVTNNMMTRTHQCLALGPSGNCQGSVVCLDLKTEKLVTRRTVKVVPMPDSIVRKINTLGKSKRGR